MTATTSTPTTPATTPPPHFGDHALNVAVAAACFRAIRRNRPLRESEAVTVFLDHEAIDAWLGSSRVTVGGRWIEVKR